MPTNKLCRFIDRKEKPNPFLTLPMLLLYYTVGLVASLLAAAVLVMFILYKVLDIGVYIDKDLFKLRDPEYFEAKKKSMKPKIESFDIESYHTHTDESKNLRA